MKICRLNEECFFKRKGKCLLVNPEEHCPKKVKPLILEDYDDYEEEWGDE
jgi:hypothetical protein